MVLVIILVNRMSSQNCNFVVGDVGERECYVVLTQDSWNEVVIEEVDQLLEVDKTQLDLCTLVVLFIQRLNMGLGAFV